MVSIVNASPTNGIVQTADGSGVVKLQSNGVTTNALAWVNFSVSGSTVTVNSQYNITSVTRSSSGRYSFAFTNTLTDANYVINSGQSPQSDITLVSFTGYQPTYGTNSASTAYLTFLNPSGFTVTDPSKAWVTFFGN